MEWSFTLDRTASAATLARSPSVGRVSSGWKQNTRTSLSRWNRNGSLDKSVLNQTATQAQALYSRALRRTKQNWSKHSLPHIETSSFLDTSLKHSSEQSSSLLHLKCKSLSVSLSQSSFIHSWIINSRSLRSLRTAVATIKSDLLELRRDRATYDFAFTQQKRTDDILTAVDRVADQSSELSSAMGVVAEDQESMASFIRSRLDALHGLKVKQLAADSGARPAPRLSYGLRESQGTHRFRRLFAGAVLISGVHCLISVVGNEVFKKMGIFGQTIDGQKLDQILVNVKGKMLNVRVFIKSKLYLTIERGRVQLQMSEQYATDFLQLLVKLPGGGVSTVRMTQRSDAVWLSIPEVGDVLYKGVTMLSAVDARKARAFVTKNLKRNAKTKQVYWADQVVSSIRFSLKESKSLLCDSRFVSRIMETECLSVHRSAYSCSGQRVTIELTQFGIYEHLLIYTERKTITIAQGDDLHGFLLGLQIKNFSTNWLTLLRSLELHACVTALIARKEL